ncbi:MAG: EAL domain-containing protein [Syntrophomonadaceae bacterium]|nr:EAL domain-containing protein [Syntrophomonadaceae bacterium]
MAFTQLDSRTIMTISVFLALFFTLGMLALSIYLIRLPGLKYWLASLLVLDLGLVLLGGQTIIANWLSVWVANMLVGIAGAGFAMGTNVIMGRPINLPFYRVSFIAFAASLTYFTFIDSMTGPRIAIDSLFLAVVITDAVYAVFSKAPPQMRFPFWGSGFLLLSIDILFALRAITGLSAPIANSLFENQSALTLGMVLLFYGLTAWIACMLSLVYGRLLYERDLSSEADMALIMESSNAGHWSIDFINDRRYYSPWYKKIRHMELEDYEQWRKVVHPDDFPHIIKEIEDHIAGKTPLFSIEHRVTRDDSDHDYNWVLAKGKVITDSAGNMLKAAGSHIDITDIKQKEEQIYQLAFHDALTGLLNRNSLSEEIDKQILNDQTQGCRGAFIFIDLDDFKLINDSYGHPRGDQLLILIARRLLTLQDEKVTLARLGGDEFIIYLKSITGFDQLLSFLRRLLGLFDEPFSLAGSNFDISVSVGVALCPDHGTDLDTLLMNADAAMYKAKETGNNLFRIYEPSMTLHSEERLLLDRDLRYAIANNEFELHYQPILNTSTYNLLGFEALIRWRKNDAHIMPANFIPRSEENGMIVPIGAWVLEQACTFAADLVRRGYTKLMMSVNISAIQIIQEGFVNMVQEVLERTGLPPYNLLLEITETAMMKSFENDSKKLQQLRDLGVHLALDDFGTGYSSLNYLKNLPINWIKLDRTFLADLDSEREKPILEIIINIAHHLGVKVVAEGIETPDQFDFLLNLSCDLVQGYLFSYPLPVEQALELAESSPPTQPE